MDSRPLLNKEISIKDFQEFYWLKKELIEFCRSESLRRSGGKIEIANRIVHYLKSGERAEPNVINTPISKSTFDWNNEKLTLETVITDNYKSTENVREFYIQEIGKQFKFNVKFMNWKKSNTGKTLRESIEVWNRINQEKKDKTKKKEIAPQFEYNTYLRDFLADNPDLKRETGIKLWEKRKSMRGDNKYRKTDLAWLKV